MYDYFVGDHHNFPVDRAAAERVIAAFPDMPIVAQANRAFLRRAVRFLLDQGAVLHFIREHDAARHVVQTIVDRIAVGSYVAFSHALSDTVARLTPERLQQASNVWNNTSAPFVARSREEISQLLEGLDLVEPGLVFAPLWCPESPDGVLYDKPGRSQMLVAVGRKPAPL